MDTFCDKIEGFFTRKGRMFVAPIPITDMKLWHNIMGIIMAFYKFVVYVRTAKRARYLYSWGRAMDILKFGYLPSLYLDPNRKRRYPR